jgi:hypothetical protein
VVAQPLTNNKFRYVPIVNPNGYCTYADAVGAIPNLAMIDTAESIFNMCAANISAIIDPTRYGANTGQISFNLTMFFFCQFVQGITNDKFYPDDYNSVTGAISAIAANGVTTTYAANIVSGNWESLLNQNEFGNAYLMLAKSLNLFLGVDGYGNPWCVL